MKIKDKIIKNTIFVGASGFMQLFLNLSFTVFAIRALGSEQYGLFSMLLILSVEGLPSLFELGTQTAASKIVAEKINISDTNELKKLSASICIFLLFIGVLLSILCHLGIHTIINQFKFDHAFHAQMVEMLHLIFLTYTLGIADLFLLGLIQGTQRFTFLTISDLLIRIIYIAIAIWGIIQFHSFTALIYAHISQLILKIITHFCFLQFKYKSWFTINPRYFSKTTLKTVLNFSILLFGTKVTAIFYHNIPKIYIAKFLGPSSATAFELVMKIVRMLKSLLGFLNATLIPATSEINSGNNCSEVLQKLYIKVIKYQALLFIPVSTTLMIFSDEVFQIGLGQQGQMGTLLIYALLINYSGPIVAISNTILIGSQHKVYLVTILTIIQTLFILIFVCALGHWAGILGVIISLPLSTAITVPAYFKIMKKFLNISILSILKNYSTMVGFGLISYAIYKVIHTLIGQFNLITFAITASFISFTHFTLILFTCFNKKDRSLVTGIFKRLRRKITPAH